MVKQYWWIGVVSILWVIGLTYIQDLNLWILISLFIFLIGFSIYHVYKILRQIVEEIIFYLRVRLIQLVKINGKTMLVLSQKPKQIINSKPKSRR